MPALENPRHEAFARYVSQGKPLTEAYRLAGYADKGARQNASRLMADDDIASRVADLSSRLITTVIAEAISLRSNRIAALQDRWHRMSQVILQRAADPSMANVPGGTTGLLLRQYKTVGSGKKAYVTEEYKVDVGLLEELRHHEQQAAEELGQWATRHESVSMNFDANAFAQMRPEQLRELADQIEEQRRQMPTPALVLPSVASPTTPSTCIVSEPQTEPKP